MQSSILAVLAAVSLTIAGSGQAATPRQGAVSLWDRPVYTRMVHDVDSDRVVIRFLPHTMARVRDGALVSLTGADLSAVSSVIASTPGAAMSPRFPQPEEFLDELRARGEARSGRVLPDLNLYAQVDLSPASSPAEAESRLRDLLDSLMFADGVDLAWAEPLVASARETGDIAVARPVGRGIPESGDEGAGQACPADEYRPDDGRSSTPDFSPLQGYLYDTPVGINATHAWVHPGGTGAGVDFIDIEWGWLWAHEDLPDPFFTSGDYGIDDHGTAVVGEVSALHNGYGVNGISPAVRTGAVSLNTFSVPGGIIEAASALDPGDIYLMEVQCWGPVNWMPCEWYQDVFDAIAVTTANGIICVEAGGNGTVDLDDPLYGGAFDRNVRDSGAIIVGAGTPYGLIAEWFTNYGSRVDLQGWGSQIVTTCCGDLQGGPPEVRYTAGFNGTSGASPIVTGALASLQGQSLALYDEVLTPELACEILSLTGSPWTGTRQIGERPNLIAARERLLLGFGDVTVRVREGDTGEPIPDAVVRVAETGREEVTGDAGEVSMQLSATSLTFQVEGPFYYPTAEHPYTVVPGQSQVVTIDVPPASLEEITGRVRGETGLVLAGATVEVVDLPLDPVVAGPDGAFLISDAPAGNELDMIAYGIPEYGVAYARVPVVEGAGGVWDPVLLHAETFEETDGGYTPFGQWQWGTPTYPPDDPVPAFSGEKVWGVRLHGPYQNWRAYALTTPMIDAGDAEQLHLGFHHWYWTGEGDGGQVQVRAQGHSDWILVRPAGGYPVESIPILSHGPGFAGNTGGEHVPALFDLSNWAGSQLEVRFFFRSDESDNGPGWYIDDVAFDFGQGLSVSVDGLFPGLPGDEGATDAIRILGAAPNPFRDESGISFRLLAPAVVGIDLYAPGGGLVRSIDLGERTAGLHRAHWDGRGEDGRSLGSGVYFYVVRTPEAHASGRIIRVR